MLSFVLASIVMSNSYLAPGMATSTCKAAKTNLARSYAAFAQCTGGGEWDCSEEYAQLERAARQYIDACYIR